MWNAVATFENVFMDCLSMEQKNDITSTFRASVEQFYGVDAFKENVAETLLSGMIVGGESRRILQAATGMNCAPAGTEGDVLWSTDSIFEINKTIKWDFSLVQAFSEELGVEEDDEYFCRTRDLVKLFWEICVKHSYAIHFSY